MSLRHLSGLVVQHGKGLGCGSEGMSLIPAYIGQIMKHKHLECELFSLLFFLYKICNTFSNNQAEKLIKNKSEKINFTALKAGSIIN